MSKIEMRCPIEASCNYFFFEASRVTNIYRWTFCFSNVLWEAKLLECLCSKGIKLKGRLLLLEVLKLRRGFIEAILSIFYIAIFRKGIIVNSRHSNRMELWGSSSTNNYYPISIDFA